MWLVIVNHFTRKLLDAKNETKTPVHTLIPKKKQFTATSIVVAPTLKTTLVTSNQKSYQPSPIDYYKWKPGCPESLDPKFLVPRETGT
jgi:hypothetical protein